MRIVICLIANDAFFEGDGLMWRLCEQHLSWDTRSFSAESALRATSARCLYSHRLTANDNFPSYLEVLHSPASRIDDGTA